MPLRLKWLAGIAVLVGLVWMGRVVVTDRPANVPAPPLPEVKQAATKRPEPKPPWEVPLEPEGGIPERPADFKDFPENAELKRVLEEQQAEVRR